MRVHGNGTKITTSSSESCVVNDSWPDPGRREATIRSPDTPERLLSNTEQLVEHENIFRNQADGVPAELLLQHLRG